MNEALRSKAREKALRDPLLQVEVNRILSENTGILKDDRSNRRLAAPLRNLLIGLPRDSKRVERGRPADIGFGSTVQRRKPPSRVAVLIQGLREWLSTQELERAREGIPERRRLEADPIAGCLEEVLAARDLRLQLFLALARGLKLLGRDALALRIEIGLLDFVF